MIKRFILSDVGPGLLAIAAIFIIPASIVFSGFYHTQKRISYFQANIKPGISTTELARIAGIPVRIVHRGESIGVATHWNLHPSLDEHTVIYVYPEEGFPYYNVLAVVDEKQNRVTSLVIDRL